MESNGSNFDIGKNVSLKVTLYDEKTSQVYTTVPSYLAGRNVLIKVYKNGVVFAEKNIAVSAFTNGTYTYQVPLNAAGNFKCTAEIVGLNIASSAIDFKTVNKPVTVIKEPSDINNEIDLEETNVFNYQFKLENIFSDGDGHDLSYEVDVTGNITYEIINGILYITVADITEPVNGTIIITAYDDYGSSASVTSDLTLSIAEAKLPPEPKDPVDPKTVIVTVIIIIVVLIVLAVAAFVVLYIKSKINVKFSIRLSVDDEEGDAHYSVYNVHKKPALIKGLPPKLSIPEVIRKCSILSESTDPDDKKIIDGKMRLANDVYVIGVPFKDAVKLFDKDKKRVCYMKTVATIIHKVNKETIKVEIAKFGHWEVEDDEY